MKFTKQYLNSSPYIGVFAVTSETISLFPAFITKKQKLYFQDILGTEIIQGTLAGSHLLGVFAVGSQNKFLVSNLISDKELDFYKNQGLKLEVLSDNLAVGNLIALNDFGAVCSPIFSKEDIAKIKSFLGTEVVTSLVGNHDLTGASCKATNVGFIVSPMVTEQEFSVLQKTLKVDGMRTTANYGDRYVGNGLIANSKGAVIGVPTTTHEMIRIDEAFRK
ncbi:MAG: translation initiation factor IF-6 [Candidatus Diapherotrites archaeon]|nr:translation initiation factor IF-6 [Candidatus Diapherotrites archaeon]